MEDPFERRAVISGIGGSPLGRRLGRDDLDLSVEACCAAVADAGLSFHDVDGLASFPSAADGARRSVTGPSVWEVQDALGLELAWYSAGLEVSSQLGAVVNACLAVASGLARHVLVYRTVTESTGQGSGGRRGVEVPGRVTGANQWLLPFDVVSGANRMALYAQRHCFEYGTTREQLGSVPVAFRAHAARNPAAVYRDPLTMEEYLDARVISTPLCLYDCDVPIDGSTAFVVSPADVARDLPQPAVGIEAVGVALTARPGWDQWEDLTAVAARDAAAQLWSRTDLGPGDVDVAALYDGFSILVLLWLEALGFCARGESGAFVEGGARIGLGGELPINTHGGQLSAGRMHGFGLLREACLQVRGQAGDRQVRDAEVALVSNGGLGPLAGCLLLTRRG
ncbi:MAG TPA: thiolase family protein [Acidimicrobiia bacterium]|nr:thiolase family protein [Acidimicrobiia bacterium]